MNTANPYRFLPLTVIFLVLMTAVPLRAQQPPFPKSGALIGLSSGQTLWIAPMDGKIQVLASKDYILPRKEGFWYIDAAIFPPENNAATAGEPASSLALDTTANAVSSSFPLWAVQLKPGVLLPRQEEVEKLANSELSSNRPDAKMEAKRNHEEEIYSQSLLFMAPDYFSLETQQGEYHTDYQLYKLTSIPATETQSAELYAEAFDPPIPQNLRQWQRDPEDPIDWSGAAQYFGIRCLLHKWLYACLLNYDHGVDRGYSAGCDVSSILPPRSMVGADEIYPAWNEIKNTYPDALDSFASPGHDLVIVVVPGGLIIAPVSNGKVGRSVARVQADDTPVMVQWALGNYVDRWTAQLKPFLSPYEYKPQQPQ